MSPEWFYKSLVSQIRYKRFSFFVVVCRKVHLWKNTNGALIILAFISQPTLHYKKIILLKVMPTILPAGSTVMLVMPGRDQRFYGYLKYFYTKHKIQNLHTLYYITHHVLQVP